MATSVRTTTDSTSTGTRYVMVSMYRVWMVSHSGRGAWSAVISPAAAPMIMPRHRYSRRFIGREWSECFVAGVGGVVAYV